MSAGADLLEGAVAAGIHCVPLPTPFPVGPINAYVLEGEPLTLVDCGANSADGMLALERGLAALGHTLADIGQLFITHQHIDHEGLAKVVTERSDAEVVCLDLLAPFLRDFDRESAADDEHTAALLVRHGWLGAWLNGRKVPWGKVRAARKLEVAVA